MPLRQLGGRTGRTTPCASVVLDFSGLPDLGSAYRLHRHAHSAHLHPTSQPPALRSFALSLHLYVCDSPNAPERELLIDLALRVDRVLHVDHALLIDCKLLINRVLLVDSNLDVRDLLDVRIPLDARNSLDVRNLLDLVICLTFATCLTFVIRQICDVHYVRFATCLTVFNSLDVRHLLVHCHMLVDHQLPYDILALCVYFHLL